MFSKIIFILLLFGGAQQLFAQSLPRRVFMGAELGTLINPVHHAYKLTHKEGVIIYRVFPKSAAEQAHLKAKDVIIAVDNQRTPHLKSFQDMLRNKHGGDTISILLMRKDSMLLTKLVLRFLPREYNFFFDTVYEQIQLDSSTQLRTLLTVPRNATRLSVIPVVVLLAPISNRSVESLTSKRSPLYQWVDSLTRKGFATLRVERKGIGDSEGDFRTWTLEEELKSIEFAVQSTYKHAYLDTSKVHVIGLGSSALIARRIAQNKNLFYKVMALPLPDFKSDSNKISRDELFAYFPELKSLNENYIYALQNILTESFLTHKSRHLFELQSKFPISEALFILQQAYKHTK